MCRIIYVNAQDIYNFLLWVMTMDAFPQSWIFVGNKPQLRNVTFMVIKESEISGSFRWSPIQKTAMC